MDQFDRDHRAQVAHIADAGKAVRPRHAIKRRAEPRADRAGAGDKALFLDDIQHRQRRGAGQRVAGIGAADPACGHAFHHIGPPGDRGDRKAAAQPLGHGHQIGGDARVFDREELSRAAKAGLDFVHDQKDPVRVADPPQLLQESRGRGVEAALALHRLDHDAGHAAGVQVSLEQSLKRGKRLLDRHAVIGVRIGHVEHIGHHRAKAVLVGHRLAGQRRRHQRAAVEGARERDEGRTARCRAGDLDRVLDRLGPGRHEVGLFREIARHQRVQPLAQRDIIGIGRGLERGVGHAVELRAHRGQHLGVAVPGVRHRDARGKVDVALALDIPELGVFGALDEHIQMTGQSSGDRRNAAFGQIGIGQHESLGVRAGARARGQEGIGRLPKGRRRDNREL